MNPAAHSPSELLPEPLPTGPMELVSAWLAAAWERAQQPNPNAMTLATSTAEGRPAARIVLCKAIVPEPGYVVFYTNYRSRKGRELEGNPRAAAVMHWDRLRRQVRIEGPVERSPAAESDAYFASRPLPSQIGAWASEQSAPVGSRAELQAAVAAAARRFGVVPEGGNLDESEGMGPASRNAAERPGAAAAGNVPRPPHWGGYRLWAEAVELWTEGAARIHDRARWTRRLTRSGGRMTAGPWSVTRLQP